ncbi:unnamed protein product [Durusdinium trenchii]|uniref:Uncharacterized protein n=2 Tax=Durusdinium trenchii TaxID=1381693 RepID=A0ABP0INZ1_9DINO
MGGGGAMQVASSMVQHADSLALLFSLLGGFFMGAYPVPIKAPSVLKVEPHPVIFQFYKSFWVFVTGWLFVVARWWLALSPVYIFSWWGIVSALGWIPSGLCTITAVPLLGVGMCVAVTTSTASVLSFLVFWLVLGENMKEHLIFGHKVYVAPVYLICIILGSAGLVYVTRTSRSGTAASRQASVGLLLAVLAGGFSAVQYGAVNLGRRSAMRAIGCDEDPSTCPDEFIEEFNNFGSWMASFGIGAMLVTMLTMAGAYGKYALCERDDLDKQPSKAPKLHLRTLLLPGTAAGLLWCSGNFFQTAAVVRGGNAVMLPANQAIQLVTSGAFGLLYYREVPNLRSAICWCFLALWTLAFILLLSQEVVVQVSSAAYGSEMWTRRV